MTSWTTARAGAARGPRRASAGRTGSRGAGRCLTSAWVLLAVTSMACGGPDRREAADSAAAGDSTGFTDALPSSACAAAPIEAEGVGVVRLGASVAAIGCPARDTSWSLEGMPERGRVVSLGNARVLAVTTGDSAVSRVIVSDPVLRTAAGVGVGSTVGELRRAYGDLCAFPGEVGGIVTVFPNFAGVSFAIDAPLPSGGSVESLPLADSARVRQVLVHGATVRCRPRVP